MRSFFVALAAISLLAAPALAEDMPKPTTSLEGVPGGLYAIDPAHTSVTFTINHLGYSNYTGRFNAVEGTLMADTSNPEKSGLKVSIPMSSLDTNHEVLEGKLKGKDWFDAEAFPTASFTSTKIQKISDSQAKVTGDLNLHGVTRPVTFDVTFNGTAHNPYAKAQAMGFSAKTVIKRSEFGIKNYLPAIGDEVTLVIETEFTQAKN